MKASNITNKKVFCLAILGMIFAECLRFGLTTIFVTPVSALGLVTESGFSIGLEIDTNSTTFNVMLEL